MPVSNIASETTSREKRGAAREQSPEQQDDFSRKQKAQAYFVHVYTASGAAAAFMAAISVVEARPVWAFIWLAVAFVIDATDGPMARFWNVKERVPRIGGHTIDDIVDYLTFTFIPLLLVWRMDWLPGLDLLWVIPAMVVSLLGFANTAAKQEADGFFLGFPSYWNVVAFYVGLLSAPLFAPVGPYLSVTVILICTVLTLVPVRFLYPNLAPHPWRWWLIAGGILWLVLLLAMLPTYPVVPLWLFVISLVYPVFYFGLSLWLDGE